MDEKMDRWLNICIIRRGGINNKKNNYIKNYIIVARFKMAEECDKNLGITSGRVTERGSFIFDYNV